MSALHLDPLTLAEIAPMIRRYYREVTERGTFMYAIQAGEDGPLKLGLAVDPADRLATLQQGNAEVLHGLAAWPVLHFEEKQLHAEFAYARIRGEWFRPVPELLELVLALGGIFCDWEPAK